MSEKQLKQLKTDISKTKQKLIGKQVYENFGQKEIRLLKDKYCLPNYSENGKIAINLIIELEHFFENYY